MDLRYGRYGPEIWEIWERLISLLTLRPRLGFAECRGHPEASYNLHLCLVQLRQSLGDAKEILARMGDSTCCTNVSRMARVITSRATRAGVGTYVPLHES